jgi:hypothetical protein
MAGHVKAWQGTAAALLIPTRAAIQKVVAFHSATGDNISYFYDLNRANTDGDTGYEWHVYTKGTFELEMPLDGVIFEQGIYVVPGENTVVTVFYRGV